MRLFVASRMTDPAAERMHRGLAAARGRTGRASWVSPHAYHLTYAFLGEHDEVQAARVGDALHGAMVGFSRYDGALCGGGFFPSDRRPRVGWLAFERPEALLAVADGVRRMLDGLGISYDRKAFRPHLTVVRIRDAWSRDDVTEFRKACDGLGRTDVRVDRVSLFRSELRPDGARHHELAAAILGA